MASIAGVYLALFGRPADPAGLKYFEGITQGGKDLSKINGLTGTAEYLNRFKDMDQTQIITSIYKSLFNREPEPGGLKYFVGELTAGRQTIETIAINVLDGASGDDLRIVNHKIFASSRFTMALDTPAEVALYSGNKAAEAGRQYLSGINTDATTIPDDAKLDAFIKALPPLPGGPFSVQQVLDGAAGTGAYSLLDRVQTLSQHLDILNKADSYSLSNAEGGVGALTVQQANILLSAKNAASFDFSLADSATNIPIAMNSAAVVSADSVAVVGTDQGEVLNFSTATRALILSGNGGDDTLVGGKFNDHLIGGAGTNFYAPGAGSNTLTLADTGADIVRLNSSALGGNLNANDSVNYITNFNRGQDKFGISNADVFTDTGPDFDPSDLHLAPWTNPTLPTYTGFHGRQGFDQASGGTLDSHNIAVYILPKLNGNANLGNVLDGTLLLRGLSAGDETQRPIAVASNWSGYAVAYANNNGYIYWAQDTNSDGKLVASEIHLKVIITGLPDDSLGAQNFTLVS